ncbi:Lrp/AsnC family transcriptional regulator [Neptuniibacter sp.]|uniref:Lrp/AsnC family transcriptional regulator n=1 Tax=Neptuniibacter sp. TaxID=1962643 RepID=UPI0026386725|nr:Lrp/AsnC family transcriptional regulator [Neptuniibacter sp.]MCP4595987.1 Lrp/AsnC family transcriptional regulator [Neptuniibacter sp.]
MNQLLRPELDETDLKIIRELESNGRQSASDIAGKIGASRPTVSKKLQRLFDNHVIKIVGITAPLSLGYETQAFIGIDVEPGTVADVAKRLASYDLTHMVAIIAGRNDILVWGLFHNTREMSAFAIQELGKMWGIKKTETMLILGIKKESFAYLELNDSPSYRNEVPIMAHHSYPELDSLDLELMAALERDGTLPISDLATKLKSSRPTIRAKLQRLQKNRCIRIVALASPPALGYQLRALIGVNVPPSGIDSVADALKLYPNVHSITVTAGRFDLMLMVLARDTEELSTFLRHNLGALSDITNTEIMVLMDVQKYTYSLLNKSTGPNDHDESISRKKMSGPKRDHSPATFVRS